MKRRHPAPPLDADVAGAGDFSYRTIKEPLTAFDVNVLRTTAGHP